MIGAVRIVHLICRQCNHIWTAEADVMGFKKKQSCTNCKSFSY